MGSIRLNLQLKQTTTTIVSKPIMKGLFLICLLSLSWIALTLGESTATCVCNNDNTCAIKPGPNWWYVCDSSRSCRVCNDRHGNDCKPVIYKTTFQWKKGTPCKCGPRGCSPKTKPASGQSGSPKTKPASGQSGHWFDLTFLLKE